MGTTASARNADNSASWTGTASVTAAEVAIARGANAHVYAREVSLLNSGSASMLFSVNGGDTWLPLGAGQSFDWFSPLYSVYVKTASGTTTYALIAGY